MDQILPVTAARDKLAEVIDDVRTMGRRVALSRHGKPVAVIMPVEDAEAIEIAEDALDKAAAIAALNQYLETPMTCDGTEVFGAATANIGYTDLVRLHVAALPGMSSGTLLQMANDLSRNGPSETVREVSDNIWSLRADGCRMVFTEIEETILVLAVAG